MLKIVRFLALAMVLALVTAACGGDGDSNEDAAAPNETAAAEQEFCDAVVAAETAVLAGMSGGDEGDVEELLADAEDAVPEAVEEEFSEVADTVREVLETGDDEAFGSDEFQETEEVIDQWVADNCGFDVVNVKAVEYAFEGVPTSLPAGNVSFAFSNEGDEVHEMLLIRYKDDETTIEDLIELSDKEAEEKIVFVGASFGPPGTTDVEIKQLVPGKYAMVCFIPVGATDMKALEKADGPPHVTRGMSAEFTVE